MPQSIYTATAHQRVGDCIRVLTIQIDVHLLEIIGTGNRPKILVPELEERYQKTSIPLNGCPN